MGADVQRVLIADSDAAVRRQLCSALLQDNIVSDCVSTTTDALAKLGGERYGVLVIDVALPFGDTHEVVSSIRQMPPPRRPVVLVLAGNPEAARTLDVDIVQIVLRRPVHLRQLVDLIGSCLRSAAARAVVPRPEEEGDQITS